MRKIDETLPDYLAAAITWLENRAADARHRRILPGNDPLFAARDKLREAIRRYAAECREG